MVVAAVKIMAVWSELKRGFKLKREIYFKVYFREVSLGVTTTFCLKMKLTLLFMWPCSGRRGEERAVPGGGRAG